MADYFDSMVYSSTLTIFLTALIFIFVYEFAFNKRKSMTTDQSTTMSKKMYRKNPRAKTNKQSDKFE